MGIFDTQMPLMLLQDKNDILRTTISFSYIHPGWEILQYTIYIMHNVKLVCKCRRFSVLYGYRDRADQCGTTHLTLKPGMYRSAVNGSFLKHLTLKTISFKP